MKFVKVTGPAFFCSCFVCGQRIYHGKAGMNPNVPYGVVWADTDGPPFKAYYCVPCKNITEQVEAARIAHEAQAAYPNAEVSGNSYSPPSLHHLPDDGDY